MSEDKCNSVTKLAMHMYTYVISVCYLISTDLDVYYDIV